MDYLFQDNRRTDLKCQVLKGMHVYTCTYLVFHLPMYPQFLDPAKFRHGEGKRLLSGVSNFNAKAGIAIGLFALNTYII